MKQSIASALVLVCSLSVTADAYAVPYDFTKIADNTGAIDSFTGTVSINNHGEVAFLGSTTYAGVYVGDGSGPPSLLYDTASGSPFDRLTIQPVINDAGQVAFWGRLAGGNEGIFRGDGGPATTIATEPAIWDFSHENVSLNNAGNVAFRARQSDYHVFLGDGGPPAKLVSTGGAVQSIYSEGLDVNNRDAAAFTGKVAGAMGVFTHDGAALTTIADETGSFSAFGGHAINDSGMVSFRAWVDGGGFAIAVGDGGPLETIVDTNTSPFLNVGNNSISNTAAVAFFGILETGQEGIYTGPDPLSHKVIHTGDLDLGAELVDVSGFAMRSLNDRGQIAFIAELADGTRGVYVATPVPEPATLTLLFALAVLPVALRSRTRRR